MNRDINKITEIGGAKILEYLILTSEKERTGNTSHIIDRQVQTEFSGLAICQYEGEEGVYLFYCDSNWKELTDTWHVNLEDVKNQASFEYKGLNEKWKKK